MKTGKLDNLGVSAFCESMAMMLQSGIQTDEAMSLLQSEEHSKGVLEQAVTIMKTQLEAGSGLADAMRKSGVFPSYALQMVEAGERTGRLESILFRLSAYYAEQKKISEKLGNAVTYPAAMLGLIITVLTVMLVMVLPAFTDAYNKLTGSLAASSYSYVRWAYALCWIALVAMLLLAIVLLTGLLLWKTGRSEIVKKLLYRNILCRQILDNMGMFRFTSALATYLASGEMQDEAVRSSLPMADCKPVEEKLEKCMLQMEKGHSFSNAAYTEKLFEPVYGRMLLAGERSGNLEASVTRLNQLLEENCMHTVDRLTGLVDPLLSGLLMVTVGLSLLSVMLPLIGMMNSIG